MIKHYRMENLDCAHCAAKMEHAICRIDGVESATVNFLAQKLTLQAPEELLDRILPEAIRVCKKIEPDCTIIC